MRKLWNIQKLCKSYHISLSIIIIDFHYTQSRQLVLVINLRVSDLEELLMLKALTPESWLKIQKHRINGSWITPAFIIQWHFPCTFKNLVNNELMAFIRFYHFYYLFLTDSPEWSFLKGWAPSMSEPQALYLFCIAMHNLKCNKFHNVWNAICSKLELYFQCMCLDIYMTIWNCIKLVNAFMWLSIKNRQIWVKGIYKPAKIKIMK